jgi:hypothetical protein
MQAYGFHFAYYLTSGRTNPIYETLIFKDTETLTKGDLLNLETGEVDLAATGDTGFVGAAAETVSGTDSTTEIQVVTGWDAVYAVTDANARAKGATLDISGATGAMTVAATSNADLVVVKKSAADEPTLVMFNPAKHYIPFS